ncbi:MAG TPA: tetratricopeptide repeat protein, partial [Chitinophagales bacterium]|nr:tetratricopeptide repeat protein [Chitinophagales bacterium]
MISRFLLLISITLLCSFSKLNVVLAQNVDVLIQNYQEQKEAGNIDSAVYYLLEIRNELENEGRANTNDYAMVLSNLGFWEQFLGDYNSALAFYLESMEIRKNVLGEQHSDYALILNNLGNLYHEMGDYASALPLYKQALEIRGKVLGELHPDYAVSLSNLGNLYHDMGDYSLALPLYQQALEIRGRVLGELHPDYAVSLNCLASLFRDLGDYSSALPLYQKSMEIRRNVLGNHHPDFAISLNNLAFIYKCIGEYDTALPLYQESLKINYQTYGEHHQEYAISLDNLAGLYQALGEYDSALPLYQQALEIRGNVLGEQHPDYATSLNNLASFFRLLNNFDLALPLYQQALEIRGNVLGDSHPQYVMSLSNLASLYQDLADYSSALPLYQKSMEIGKNALGEKHPDYALILNNLGNLYHEMGDYASALPLYQQALEIRGKVLGELHPDYATSLGNLAGLYQDLGDYSSALPLYQKSMEICKRTYGNQHPAYALSLNNLAVLYQLIGDYTLALPLYQESHSIYKKIFGTQNLDYAMSLNNLSVLYQYVGDYSSALPLIQESIEIRRQILGDMHPDYGMSLNNLAVLYESTEDYSSAIPPYLESLEVIKKTYGDRHPKSALILTNLGLCYYNLGEINLADSFLLCAIDIYLDRAKMSSRFLGEQQQKKYWNKYSELLQLIQSFCVDGSSLTAQRPLILNMLLESQSYILKEKTRLNLEVSSSSDSAVIKLYNEYLLKGQTLFAIESLPFADRKIDSDSLRKIVMQLEEQLTLVGSEKLNIQHLKPPTWEEISTNLNPDEVAIVYSHFNYYTLNDWTDMQVYVAYVITPGCLAPSLVPLFEEKWLTTLLDSARGDLNALYSYDRVDSYGDDLWRLIWKPLDSFLLGAKHVYFSATGLLNGINLTAIPNGIDEKNLPMLVNYDMYQFINIGSVLDSILIRKEYLNGPITAFGGLNYDISDKEWLHSITDRSIVSRGSDFYSSDSNRSGYKFLPYAFKEVEAIANIAREHNTRVQLFTGNDGLEEQYRQLAGESSPVVLHLATHAVFLEDVHDEIVLSGFDRYQYSAEKDPMYRSRLMLSGANRILKGGKLPEGVLDGILTANDVSTITLPNTELVVLSACQTGVGDYDASEGVYGLQRAFKMVGVDNIIMTLNEVNDASTSAFMITYYEKLINGISYHDAFRETQIDIINSQYRL